MGFLGRNYAPPSVYTRTLFENPLTTTLDSLKIPMLIGEGNEFLFQQNLEIVRGSSASVDQQVVQEDQTGRAVVSISNTGAVTLGAFNGERTKLQVRNFPLVSGDGSGTTTNNRSAVQVTVNGQPLVVMGVDGTKGIITLVQAPKAGDLVRCTYFFNRTDTYITDNLSDQITTTNAQIKGQIGVDVGIGETFSFNTTNNVLFFSNVDTLGEKSITIPLGLGGTASYTPSQIVAFIIGAGVGSLTASTFINNFGKTAIALSSNVDITLGNGSANAVFGFVAGSSTGRNRIFYTFQGPIVDGTNGGVTTTDPADVTVRVNNAQVIPTSVDGQTRAVTLPYAPAAGSTVTISYFFNTWQNTFDYLANIGVTEVTRCGITSDRNDYLNKADFVLKDDTLVWGTAALISSGVHTTGSEFFGTSQISTTLIDDKIFLAPCDPVVQTSLVPPEESSTEFQLPYQPTTGNGRGSPLGLSLFQTVSNNRIDLPTNRPDLVRAYWGYGVQDALDRGVVTVLEVDSENSRIRLASDVPKGATVYCTFYYNRLTDNEYTLTTLLPGISNVGTYTVKDAGENDVYGIKFDIGSKSASLNGITLTFPSGSEYLPDTRFESVAGTQFIGPTEETVTVTFDQTEPTPARYVTPGNDPYFPIEGSSDHIRIKVDNTDLVTGATGIDLGDVTGTGSGFMASLLSDEIPYDASTGGISYTLDSSNNLVNLLVDGVQIAATVVAGAGKTIADFVTAINTAALAGGTVAPSYIAPTVFDASYTVTVNEYDQLRLAYIGDAPTTSGTLTITLAPGTYNTAAELATQVNTQLLLINGAGGLFGTLTCAADASGRLKFTLAKAAADGNGFLEFISHGTATRDFATIAGIDTDTAPSGGQMKLCDVDIARRFTVGTTPLLYDRMVLRNRLVPGGGGTQAPFFALEQTNLLIQGTNAKAGFQNSAAGLAGWRGSVTPPTLFGAFGFSGGLGTGFGDARDGQPVNLFYDGSGTNAVNNVFKFTLDGQPVVVTFTASGTGTSTALGTETITGSILNQIQLAMAALPGAPFGNLVAIQAAKLVRQEGAGIRITSPSSDSAANIEIGDGSANSVLGFSEGQSALRTGVEAAQLASALMNHAQSAGNFNLMLLSYNAPAATYFAGKALASTLKDDVNNEYLYLQSLTTGTSSVLEWAASSSDDIMLYGTGLNTEAGNGAVGETGKSGFFVTSTDPNGSGSINTSMFNSGVGQDGTVGQTYIDLVTGLAFTILPRTGNLNYPVAGTFRLAVSKTFTTDANIPTKALNGVELLVANTNAVAISDTALVETFERGGQEPAVGDLYYVSYIYTKQDFTAGLYTKLSAIEAAYGEVSLENPVSLAAYFMILNGAVLVGIQQVPKAPGERSATLVSYRDAVDDLARPLPGGFSPDILLPLRGDSLAFFQYITRHADIMSSPRYKAERTVIAGVAGGTDHKEVQNVARAVKAGRFRLCYPDVAVTTLTDSLNRSTEILVDGPYLASALGGSVVSPNVDVATPWTGRLLVGFNQLARILDAVEQNQVAVAGVTLLEDRPPFLRVRHGLTTDMADILTKTPTIIQIADEVQRQSRDALEVFIGVKFLQGILTQVEGRLAKVMADLQQGQIITAFTGVKATVDATDPTQADVEAFYSPVFPLLYLWLTFHLRSSLNP